MDEAAMIRDLQFDQLRRAQLSVRYLLEQADARALDHYRDGGTGWTVTAVLCHLRDFESVFLERAQLTVKRDFPDLPFPDAEQLALAHRYTTERAWPAFEDWQRRRRAYLEYVECLPVEAWTRAGNHPTRGRYTLMQQLALSCWHDVNHLEQIARILLAKKG